MHQRLLIALVTTLVSAVSTSAAASTAAASASLPATAPPARADGPAWIRPVGPPGGPLDIVRGYDPPARPWLAGHRGVDVAAPVGAEVRAAGPGRVAYAGMLAGRGVVAVDHGSVRTTYEPVKPSVTAGTNITAAQRIGTVARAGSHCAPRSCLHWGARTADGYRDPVSLVAASLVRLLPLGARTVSGDPPPRPASRLRWPVVPPRVTSPFGMRTHPITGVRALHDGTDLAAACGAAVRAAAPGTVSDVGVRGAYGLQLTVRHGVIGGTAMTTSYSHLSETVASVGDVVGAGGMIGLAGTSGSSTGCHLHFMVYADGRVVDPASRLPSRSAAQRDKALNHAEVLIGRSPTSRGGHHEPRRRQARQRARGRRTGVRRSE